MGDAVKVEVVGQVAPGSVLRVAMDEDDGPGGWNAVIDAVREVAGHDRFLIVNGDVAIVAPPTEPPPEGGRWMDLAEFQALGLVQEVNRRLLHPLGLALAWVREDDGTMRFAGIRDDRDDPEGHPV